MVLAEERALLVLIALKVVYLLKMESVFMVCEFFLALHDVEMECILLEKYGQPYNQDYTERNWESINVSPVVGLNQIIIVGGHSDPKEHGDQDCNVDCNVC